MSDVSSSLDIYSVHLAFTSCVRACVRDVYSNLSATIEATRESERERERERERELDLNERFPGIAVQRPSWIAD